MFLPHVSMSFVSQDISDIHALIQYTCSRFVGGLVSRNHNRSQSQAVPASSQTMPRLSPMPGARSNKKVCISMEAPRCIFSSDTSRILCENLQLCERAKHLCGFAGWYDDVLFVCQYAWMLHPCLSTLKLVQSVEIVYCSITYS